MRRTDLSRRLGKAIVTIEDLVSIGREVTTKELTEIVKNELGLKASKATTVGTHTVIPFKDSNFEGTLKKTDIYNVDPRAKELGVKEIKNNFATVQLVHTFNSPTGENKVELKLVVDVDFMDNQGKKHKAFPVLKSLEVPLNDVAEDEVALAETVVEEEIENIKDNQIEDDVENTVEEETIEIESEEEDKDYKYYIGEALTTLFGNRFFGSEPSSEFKEVVIDKLHNIYVPHYLEFLFNSESIENNECEGMMALKRILDTL